MGVDHGLVYGLGLGLGLASSQYLRFFPLALVGHSTETFVEEAPQLLSSSTIRF